MGSNASLKLVGCVESRSGETYGFKNGTCVLSSLVLGVMVRRKKRFTRGAAVIGDIAAFTAKVAEMDARRPLMTLHRECKASIMKLSNF